MKTLYVLSVGTLFALGFWFIFKVGYKPTAEIVMRPAPFADVNAIASAVFDKIEVEYRSSGRLVLGVPPQPEWYLKVVDGLLQTAASKGVPFEVVIAEVQMPKLDLSEYPGIEMKEVPTNTETQAELFDALSGVLESKKRTLIYLPSLFSAHLVAGNVVNRMESHLGEKLLAVTLAPFSLNASQEFVVHPPCVGVERDKMGTSDLGCAILKVSRDQYRNELRDESYNAMISTASPHDYLVMIAAPHQGANAERVYKQIRMQAPGAGKGELPTGGRK